MDLAKYQELTGTTVSEADKVRVNASIRRANVLLESALGYSLSSSKNIDKEELGKVQFEGDYPYYPIERDVLLPADDPEGEYRLFAYNAVDPYIKTDPFRNIYHVKLVQAMNDDQFVTIYDLDGFTPKPTGKFSRFVERQNSWFRWGWYGWLMGQVGGSNGLLVAVDADWMNCKNMPSDIAFLWTDMVAYYSSEDISVTGNLKSESIQGHSYSYEKAVAPETLPDSSKILSNYVGPNGNLALRRRV